MAELVADGGIGEPQDAAQKRPEAGTRTATTWEGCSVLLDINDGDRLVFARLSPAASVKIGNKKLPLSPLIGCPFGSLFRVESGAGAPRLERCVPALSSGKISHESSDGCIVNGAKDNRSLIDNNKAQNLSSDDIDTMRRDGATGDEIIEALIANSSTYEQKTQYSQEKYKLKKQKKYAPKVLLRRPSARSICETYFKKHPARTGFLRVDSLSLLLSMANIGAYSDVLVVDMVGGLVTGAVAERLGGTGCVCSTYFGARPNPIDIIRMFNFDAEVCSRIFQAPFSDLHKSHDNLNPDVHSDDSKLPVMMESVSSDSLRGVQPEQITEELDPSLGEQIPANGAEPDPLSSGLCSASTIDLKHENNTSVSHGQQKAGRAPSIEAIELWKTRGFTSLIVATADSDVSRIAQELFTILSYSAPFAIYHQYLQPLATCMNTLQKSKMAINLQITEPWLREYQVLPSRTHPMMQMSASGGYILSGTRICNDEFYNGGN